MDYGTVEWWKGKHKENACQLSLEIWRSRTNDLKTKIKRNDCWVLEKEQGSGSSGNRRSYFLLLFSLCLLPTLYLFVFYACVFFLLGMSFGCCFTGSFFVLRVIVSFSTFFRPLAHRVCSPGLERKRRGGGRGGGELDGGDNGLMTFFFSQIPHNGHDGRSSSMFVSEDTVERIFCAHFAYDRLPFKVE